MGNNFTISSEVLDFAEYLDKRGYALQIVKKPKQYNKRNVFDIAKEGFPSTHFYYGRNKVRELREKAGLSQYQLACAMGVDRNIVIRMEDVMKRHTEETMQRFADFFGCTINDLLEE